MHSGCAREEGEAVDSVEGRRSAHVFGKQLHSTRSSYADVVQA